MMRTRRVVLERKGSWRLYRFKNLVADFDALVRTTTVGEDMTGRVHNRRVISVKADMGGIGLLELLLGIDRRELTRRPRIDSHQKSIMNHHSISRSL
jgi:hypothetical protein